MERQLTPPAPIGKRWSSPCPLPEEPRENGSSLSPGEGNSHFEISLMNSKVKAEEGPKTGQEENLLQLPQGRIAAKSVVSRGELEERMEDSVVLETPLRGNQMTKLL